MSDVEILGARRLQRTMHAAAADLADLTDANTDAGALVATEAARRAPALTGRLRRSIRADGHPTDATITANTPYAAVIEYGWPAHHITASGYLAGAVEHTRTDVVGTYLDALDDALDTVKGI